MAKERVLTVFRLYQCTDTVKAGAVSFHAGHLYEFAKGQLQFGLAEGAMISSGRWYLEMNHHLKAWERLSQFFPGDVSAFAEDGAGR